MVNIKGKLTNAANKVKTKIKNASHRLQAYAIAHDITGLSARGASMVEKIVGLSVGLLVAAITLPIAFDELAEVEASSWPSAVETVMTVLLPVLGVIAIVLYIIDSQDISM